jgi:hypothetical protein
LKKPFSKSPPERATNPQNNGDFGKSLILCPFLYKIICAKTAPKISSKEIITTIKKVTEPSQPLRKVLYEKEKAIISTGAIATLRSSQITTLVARHKTSKDIEKSSQEKVCPIKIIIAKNIGYSLLLKNDIAFSFNFAIKLLS